MLNDRASKSRTGSMVVRKPSLQLLSILLLCGEFPLAREKKVPLNPTISPCYTYTQGSPRGCSVGCTASLAQQKEKWLRGALGAPVPALEPQVPDCLLLEHLHGACRLCLFFSAPLNLVKLEGMWAAQSR